jgi:spermidine synthase
MLRRFALLLTVLTGFSGLVYEVTWQKALATLLGTHSEATAAVLGIFLGGLSAGYALFGTVTRSRVARAERENRPARLLVLYGCIEAAVGLYALVFPFLFGIVQRLSLQLPHGNPAVAFAADLVLSTLLIGPPAVLMGGTIPILTQALARGLQDATRVHAFVYAFNTAGAFAGALAGGLLLIPRLGIENTLLLMGLVNLFAGSSFLALGLRSRAHEVPASQTAPTSPRLEGFALYAAAAFLLGFAMMTVQTVLIRIGGLAFGASQFTFAMVVAVFVLCIALGSFAVTALHRIPRPTLVLCTWGLAGLLALLYLELPNTTYYAHVLRSLFRDHEASFYPYFITAFAGVLLILLVPVALSGAALPLLFHHLRNRVGDLGNVAGRLYSWNTLGNLLGALLGGYALLFWLDMHLVYRVAAGAVALAAGLLSVRITRISPRVVAAGMVFPALLALTLLPSWDSRRLNSGLFRSRAPEETTFLGPAGFFAALKGGRIIFHDDDPVSSVVVREARARGRVIRSILTNGKSDGSLGSDYPTMALIALLPCLMTERCESAFVIGYGTGVTAGEFAALETMRRVVVAEISPGVVAAAPLFDYGNLRASENPKVTIVRSDAYRALLRSEERYDAIASEPSNPWVVGVEMLFSREFLEAAKSRLNPGGVYAQWFHAYETDTATVELVMRTYAAVFDHVALWFTKGPDMLLLGFENAERALDLERIEERAARPDVAAGLRRSGIRSFPALLAHELLPLGVVHAAPLEGEIHTLLHPILSHRAARAFYVGAGADLPVTAQLEAARVGTRNSLLRRYAERHGGILPDEDRREVVAQVCRSRPIECATLLAEWQHEAPGSAALVEALEGSQRTLEAGELETSPEELASLFASGDDGSFAPGPAEAKRATELFTRFYHHAAPFRRDALHAIWARCGSQKICERGRRGVEERLGRLQTEKARRPGLEHF